MQNVSEYPQNSYSSLFIIFPALFYHFLTFKILFFDDVIYLVEILVGDLTSLTKLAISCQCFIYKIMVIVYLKALDYPSLFTCVRQKMFITNNSISTEIDELAQNLHRKNVSIKNFQASKTNERSSTFSYKFLYKKFNFSFQNFSIFNLKIVLSFFRSFARLFVRSLDCSFVHVNVGTYPSIIF